MITNEENEEEVITTILDKSIIQLTFYQVQFNQTIMQKLIESLTIKEKVKVSFTDCQNISKNDVYRMFDALSNNLNLKKLHMNLISIDEIQQEDYNQLYSKLILNQYLQTIYCPNYGIIVKSISDLFNQNQNIQNIIVTLLDKTYFKSIFKFLSSIKREFIKLKIQRVTLSEDDYKFYSSFQDTIYSLNIQKLKIKAMKIIDMSSANSLIKLFFNFQGDEIEIEQINLTNYMNISYLVNFLNDNNNLKKIKIQKIDLSHKQGFLDFKNLQLNQSITSYELGLPEYVQIVNFEQFIQSNNQLIELFCLTRILTDQLIHLIGNLPNLKKLGVYINSVKLYQTLLNSQQSQLDFLQINIATQFFNSDLDDNILEDGLQIKAKECKIVIQSQKDSFQKLMQFSSLFEKMIQINQHSQISIYFRYSTKFLYILLAINLVKYSNLYQLENSDSFSFVQAIKKSKQIAMMQIIAFNQYIQKMLTFSPKQILYDFYF